MFIIFQKLVPQHLLSRFVGALAKTTFFPVKWLFIRLFVYWFKVDLSEAEREKQNDYVSFNDFFTRRLKSGARPVDPDPSKLICPADGIVSYCGHLKGGSFIQAKTRMYPLTRLLANHPAASDFEGGSFATIYLSPKDYHRVHVPSDASLKNYTYVPGRLFSVNQKTSNEIDNLFAVNERLICHFITANGPMVLIMVGALIVAAIKPAWRDDCFKAGQLVSETLASPLSFKAGDELGTFQLGSTVILLTPKTIDWRIAPEQQVRMGTPLNH